MRKAIIIPLYDHTGADEVADILSDLERLGFSKDPYYAELPAEQFNSDLQHSLFHSDSADDFFGGLSRGFTLNSGKHSVQRDRLPGDPHAMASGTFMTGDGGTFVVTVERVD